MPLIQTLPLVKTLQPLVALRLQLGGLEPRAAEFSQEAATYSLNVMPSLSSTTIVWLQLSGFLHTITTLKIDITRLSSP